MVESVEQIKLTEIEGAIHKTWLEGKCAFMFD